MQRSLHGEHHLGPQQSNASAGDKGSVDSGRLLSWRAEVGWPKLSGRGRAKQTCRPRRQLQPKENLTVQGLGQNGLVMLELMQLREILEREARAEAQGREVEILDRSAEIEAKCLCDLARLVAAQYCTRRSPSFPRWMPMVAFHVQTSVVNDSSNWLGLIHCVHQSASRWWRGRWRT